MFEMNQSGVNNFLLEILKKQGINFDTITVAGIFNGIKKIKDQLGYDVELIIKNKDYQKANELLEVLTM